MSFEESLATARAGQAQHVAQLLERCRPYLLAIAQDELPTGLGGKVGASDLVQETIVKGLQHFPQFQGSTPEELAGWLRRILLNHLANVGRSYAAEKREIGREQPVTAGLADALSLSPSGAALSREQWEQLDAALERLGDDARQAILLRHRDNLSFAEIGAALNKSEEAARKVWARAVEKLQKENPKQIRTRKRENSIG